LTAVVRENDGNFQPGWQAMAKTIPVVLLKRGLHKTDMFKF
jgi:hypothetical protein